MTNKIEISRELAQKVDDLLYILTGHDSHPKMIRKYGEEFWIPIDQLRAELCTAIAAPAVERQEPVGRVSYIGNGFIRVRCDAPPELESLVYTSPPTPSVERQELAVWEGSMPESNGKSNFTVILHSGDITEGICVYRSEYPDRARYEADCFRHLIGDPAFTEKPYICDYDADKHSGYVKPDTSPPAPVAVVLPERKSEEPSDYRAFTQLRYSEGWNACLDKVKEMNR